MVALILGMVLVDKIYLNRDLIVQRCGCFLIHMVLLCGRRNVGKSMLALGLDRSERKF